MNMDIHCKYKYVLVVLKGLQKSFCVTWSNAGSSVTNKSDNFPLGKLSCGRNSAAVPEVK